MDERVQAAVAAALEANAGKAGALIEILHAVQERLGCIPREAVPAIARAQNLSRAEVHGVIGFYHDFRSEPAGEVLIQVCRAEACQATGLAALEAHLRDRLGIDYHQTTADGGFSLEPTYCLGNCACAPSMRIGDQVYARMTPERFDEIVPPGSSAGPDADAGPDAGSGPGREA
jgi:formate dehydrogenase subunit gamma